MATKYTGNNLPNQFSPTAGGANNFTITTNSDFTVEGLNGNDSIILDTLSGGVNQQYVFDSTIQAGQGNDSIVVSSVFESKFFGGEGNDTLVATDAGTFDSWNSSTFQDLSGENVVELTFGGSYAVTDSSIRVGSGTDSILLNDVSGSTIRSGESSDTVEIVSATSSKIFTGRGNDNFTAGGDLTRVLLQSVYGNNSFTALDLLSSTLQTGSGLDTIVLTDVTSSSVRAGAGNDSISVAGAVSASSIFTGAGSDVLDITGTVDSAYIQSLTGNNAFTFGDNIAGASFIQSGDGQDTIDISAADLTGNSLVRAGKLNDTILVTDVTTSSIFAGAGNDTITATGTLNEALLESVIGEDLFVLASQTATNSSVIGADGDDILQFSDATTDAFFGANTVLGITTIEGQDLAVGTDAETAGITTLLGLDAAGTLDARDYTTSVTIDASASTSSYDIFGGSAADTLIGGDNIDSIVSGGGNDTMTGGSANDVFSVTEDFGSSGVEISDFITAADEIELAISAEVSTGVALSAVDFEISGNSANLTTGSLSLLTTSGNTLVMQGADFTAAWQAYAGAGTLTSGAAKLLFLDTAGADAGLYIADFVITAVVATTKIQGVTGTSLQKLVGTGATTAGSDITLI